MAKCSGCYRPVDTEMSLTVLDGHDNTRKDFCSYACIVFWAKRLTHLELIQGQEGQI